MDDRVHWHLSDFWSIKDAGGQTSWQSLRICRFVFWLKWHSVTMLVTCATDSGDEKMRQFYFCRVTFFHLEVCHRITFAPFIIFFLDLFPFIFGCWELRDCQCWHRILSLYFFSFRLSVVWVTYFSIYIFFSSFTFFYPNSSLQFTFSPQTWLRSQCSALFDVRLRLHLSAQGKIIWSAFFLISSLWCFLFAYFLLDSSKVSCSHITASWVNWAVLYTCTAIAVVSSVDHRNICLTDWVTKANKFVISSRNCF